MLVEMLVVIARIGVLSGLLLLDVERTAGDAAVAKQYDSLAEQASLVQREARGFYDEWDFHKYLVADVTVPPSPEQVDSLAIALGDHRQRIIQADEGLVETLPFLAQTKQKEAKRAAIVLHVDAAHFIEEANQLDDELEHLVNILQSLPPVASP